MPLQPDDTVPLLMRDEVPRPDKPPIPIMRVVNGRCAAYDGKLGHGRCTIYDQRPKICKVFKPGSWACIDVRKQWNLE